MKSVLNGDDKIIGANVRRLRMLRGLSQEKLGVEIGLTFQQIQKYEKGSNRVSGSRIVQLARIFSVPVSELFRGVSDDNKAPSIAPDDPVLRMGQSAIGIEVCEHFTRLPVTIQRSVATLVADLDTVRGSSHK